MDFYTCFMLPIGPPPVKAIKMWVGHEGEA